jgi:hypothetical protein
MLRASAFQPEYGLIGAGAVNASLIGRLPGKSRALGPVAGVSYRVASRIANTLKAGEAVRTADELDGVRVILFHAPSDQFATLAELLKEADIGWRDKSLVFCDCEVPACAADHFRGLGADVAVLRRCAIPGRVVVEGSGAALTMAHRMARDLHMKAIEITPGCGDLFEAALTIGTGALTPLIDHATSLLRSCGVRDKEALQLAGALFGQTVREFSHSGRQSWSWYVREPDPERVVAHIEATENGFQNLLGDLVLRGFEQFGKHGAAAEAIRARLVRPARDPKP